MNECKYRFRGQYSKENNEQILLFDLEEPEVIKHEIIQEDLPDVNTSEGVKDTENKEENKTKKIVRTLFRSSGRIILDVGQRKLFFYIELSIAGIGMCCVQLKQ